MNNTIIKYIKTKKTNVIVGFSSCIAKSFSTEKEYIEDMLNKAVLIEFNNDERIKVFKEVYVEANASKVSSVKPIFKSEKKNPIEKPWVKS